jgi:hypothetical protein
MLIVRHFHGILVGKDKDNLRFPIFDEQNVRSIMSQVDWLPHGLFQIQMLSLT